MKYVLDVVIVFIFKMQVEIEECLTTLSFQGKSNLIVKVSYILFD